MTINSIQEINPLNIAAIAPVLLVFDHQIPAVNGAKRDTMDME
jgi:hypothetical protein